MIVPTTIVLALLSGMIAALAKWVVQLLSDLQFLKRNAKLKIETPSGEKIEVESASELTEQRVREITSQLLTTGKAAPSKR